MLLPPPLKIAIIAAAALLAGAANQRYLANHVRKEAFVATADMVAEGKPFRLDRLRPAYLAGDLAAARSSLIPWQERALLSERIAGRKVEAGQFLFRQDVEHASSKMVVQADHHHFTLSMRDLRNFEAGLAVGDRVQFILARDTAGSAAPVEPCGPFTVCAIDNSTAGATSIAKGRDSAQTITLSTPSNEGGTLPLAVQRLMQAVAGASDSQIVAIEHIGERD